MHAAGVHNVPLVMSVWDDGYGISVDNSIQTIKKSISSALKGFQKETKTNGIEIFTARGWNYPELLETYRKADQIARQTRVPVLVHITELTQPLGHSSSGSHERYKSAKRLAWEKEYDCISQFKNWILNNSYDTNKESLPIATKKS